MTPSSLLPFSEEHITTNKIKEQIQEGKDYALVYIVSFS